MSFQEETSELAAAAPRAQHAERTERTEHAERTESGRLPGVPRERKTEARQRHIAEQVVARGSCSPQELATDFGVSIMTIHRDLESL